METYKFIYWRTELPPKATGEVFANVHLLVGYTQCSLLDFLHIADKLRETFPLATDDEIGVGKIFAPSPIEGFTILTWNSHIARRPYPGWVERVNAFWDYHW